MPGSQSLTRSRIGIVAALAAEARTLGLGPGLGPWLGLGPGRALRRARRLPGGLALRVLSDGALLAVSGMGSDAAERSARALVDAGCDALVSWGLAGGLDPGLATGTITIPAVLMLGGAGGAGGDDGGDGGGSAPDLSTSSDWRAQVADLLGGEGLVVAGGRLLTSRRPLASAAAKRKAFLETGAVAVDMESYAIASVASAHRLPFIAIRVIVDAAEDEVPGNLLDAAGSRGRIAVGRLVVRVLASPGTLRPLLRLAHRYRVARRSLREAARAGAGAAGLGSGRADPK